MPQTPEPAATPSKRRAIAYTAGGAALYLGIAFSLGWYYTFSYYGKTGIPMPHPESCAALLLYYFSVINAATEIQAVHWLIVFPVAGWVWSAAIVLCARWRGVAAWPMARIYWAMGLACLPVVLPGPAMALLAGWADGAFAADRMFAVALRRGFVTPAPWLTPLYLTLGTITFFAQVAVFRRAVTTSGWQAVRLYAMAWIALTIAVILLGTLASYPLRFWFE